MHLPLVGCRKSISGQLLPVLQREVLVARAHEKFDAEGRLADEVTRRFLGQCLATLRDWLRHVPA